MIKNGELSAWAKRIWKNAKRSGKARTQPEACELCAIVMEVLEGHHEDYSKPLDVVYLCNACHNLVHEVHRQDAEAYIIARREARVGEQWTPDS